MFFSSPENTLKHFSSLLNNLNSFIINFKNKIKRLKYLNTFTHSSLTHPINYGVIQVPENCQAVVHSIPALYSAVEFDVASFLYHDITTICVMNMGMSLWNVQCILCKECLSETPISHQSQEY